MSNTDFVNTAPGGSGWTCSSAEDYRWTFDFWFFNYVFSDADSNGIKGIIYEESAHLTLFMNGVAVEPGTFVTLSQHSQVNLQPDENFYGSTTFRFRYVDDGGTENGGNDTSDMMTWNFYFSSVNDAPTAQDKLITTDEDTSSTLSVSDFGFADVDGDSLFAVIIDRVPGTGTLLLDGVAVTAGQSVSAVDIAAGKLVWTPPANGFGNALASLEFRVTDVGNVSQQYSYYDNGYVKQTSISSNTLTFNVTSLNDAPTAADGAVALDRGEDRVFTVADFSFSDIEGDQFQAVVVSRIDGAGRLLLDGVEVMPDQEVSAEDIAAGKLVWIASDLNGVEGSFELGFRVVDSGQAGGRHGNTSTTEYTLRLGVNAVPILSAADVSTREDKGVSIDVLAQADDADGDVLSLVSAQVLSGGFGDVSIVDGKLFYDPTAAANQNLAAGETRTVTIRYTVSDGHGDDTTAEIAVTVVGIEGDRFNGTDGNDRLIGSIHGDVLDGGRGADRMEGRAGNDTYIVDNARDVVVESANRGIDLVKASVSHTLSNHVENLTLTGTGKINGTGNSLANVLTGNGANNILDGGKGADILKGGAGRDTLIGGAGADKLYGGAGADTFVFRSIKESTPGAAGRDRIVDFSHADGDRIDLRAIDANTTLKGNQAFRFIEDDAFSGKAGELRYQKKGGDTFILGNVDGDRSAEFAIKVTGRIDFEKGDFLL